jgi:hypothetical protein
MTATQETHERADIVETQHVTDMLPALLKLSQEQLDAVALALWPVSPFDPK